MFDYKKQIAALVAYDDLPQEEAEALITATADSQKGDYTLTCFSLAKKLRLAPPIIAAKIKASMRPAPFIDRVEAVGGYLNFFIERQFYVKTALDWLLHEGAEVGRSDEGKGKTVCIDYSSINIAKRFHIGHLSTTVIGGSLCRIFRRLGYSVVGINHLGDWGTQFGKLLYAYFEWSDAKQLEEGGIQHLQRLYERFHQEEKNDPRLSDAAREWFKRIEQGEPRALETFHKFREITLKDAGKTYAELNVQFDSYNGESFYNDKLDEVEQILRSKGLLKKDDGALIVDLEGYDMPPCLIRRSDGASLYATRDIAAALYRKRTYDFDKCLYVVAYQQNLHFKQVFMVLELMGYDWADRLVHVPFGMVSLPEGTMSTREGNVVYLADVLQKAVEKTRQIIEEKNPALSDRAEVARQIGISAVVFSALSGARIKDVVFSYDRVLNFEGETGPYIQYTHARAATVLARATLTDVVDYSGITDDSSAALLRVLSQFPSVVVAAAARYEPSLIAHQLIDICKAFNKFYLDNKILCDNEGVRNARVLLTKATKDVLGAGLHLLLMHAPTSM